MPSIGLTPTEVLSDDLGPQAVARSMTGSAVPDAVCQVRAPVPLRIVPRVRLVGTLVEKSSFQPAMRKRMFNGKGR